MYVLCTSAVTMKGLYYKFVIYSNFYHTLTRNAIEFLRRPNILLLLVKFRNPSKQASLCIFGYSSYSHSQIGNVLVNEDDEGSNTFSLCRFYSLKEPQTPAKVLSVAQADDESRTQTRG